LTFPEVIDNGSGLPGEAGEIRNTVLRLMIRDKNGDWFAGDYFAPNSAQSNLGLVEDYSMFSSTNEMTYTRSLSADSWYAISETGVLNAFANSDEVALTISGTAGNPDLTEVTGMGIYLHNSYNSTDGRFEISSMSLVPEPGSISMLLFGAGIAFIVRKIGH